MLDYFYIAYCLTLKDMTKVNFFKIDQFIIKGNG